MENKTKTKTTLLVLVALMVTSLMMFAPLFVLADTSDVITGTVTIGNATPTISDIEIVNSTFDIVTSWLPNNTDIYGINTTVGDGNFLDDIYNISWYIYDDSVHGSDWDSASANGYDLVIVTWNESNDLWTVDQGAFTHWTMQTSEDCTGTCATDTSYEFSAQFDISYAALADTDWNVTAIVFDDSDATANTTSGTTFTMSNYFEILIDNDAYAWGTVTTLSTNNTATTNRTLSIKANAAWEIRIKADDMTASAEPSVDLDTVDAVAWSDDETEGDTNSLWFTNTYVTAKGTWDAQSAMPSETELTRQYNVWFTDTGDFASLKEYECIMYVLIQADT
jgi:hypothetical protein